MLITPVLNEIFYWKIFDDKQHSAMKLYTGLSVLFYIWNLMWFRQKISHINNNKLKVMHWFVAFFYMYGPMFSYVTILSPSETNLLLPQTIKRIESWTYIQSRDNFFIYKLSKTQHEFILWVFFSVLYNNYSSKKRNHY